MAHNAGIVFDDTTWTQVNLAAAVGGMSASRYVRAAVAAALMTHEQNDAVVRAAFRALAKHEREASELVSA